MYVFGMKWIEILKLIGIRIINVWVYLNVICDWCFEKLVFMLMNLYFVSIVNINWINGSKVLGWELICVDLMLFNY